METVKIQDLRIGNYVNFKNRTDIDFCEVTHLGMPEYVHILRNFKDGEHNDDQPENIKDITGIPLTEDILLRLGFEGQMFGTIKTDAYKKGIITVHLISGNTGECQIALYNKLLPIFYNYVHELQNLAYDLRQELTLNP